MTISEITSRIPHRSSMLLLDRVHFLVPGSHAIASKAVTATEWCYESEATRREYGYPIGLVLESFNQTAALLTTHDNRSVGGRGAVVSVLGSYTDVHIEGTVYPGDVMVHHAIAAGSLGGAEFFTGTTSVNGTVILRVERSVLARRDAALLPDYPA
ncbi:3-hydroxyacyl-ACP dehydratase FabZ family protein [Nocardia sp. NPDC127579]|uniref:3-hydroxyacyl-ACP dehydratase FabZ family protein n=1 Tax=Nocardia sp. NPDC127579 TaxID=3345402 RepID=UPI00362F020C